MKVLVIGSGGREHSLVWKIKQSKKVSKIYSIPGNAGISELAECVNLPIDDFEALDSFVKEKGIDWTLVGPEKPLVEGIVNIFEERGRNIFGPRKEAALIEGSKVFSKDLMKKYSIPTASYEVFDSQEKAKEYLNEIKYPVVVKADGLPPGKGGFIAGGWARG